MLSDSTTNYIHWRMYLQNAPEVHVLHLKMKYLVAGMH